jgi:hypothetical protein
MSSVSESILEERESAGPWSYSSRVPEGASSRDYAFLPLVIALLFGGIGIFLASDVGHSEPFWSNAAVWIGIILSTLSVALSVWMFWGRWAWTAPQMGLFGLAACSLIFWACQGSALTAFVLYSDALILTKVCILVSALAWHGWWIQQTAKRCFSIWTTIELREKVWLSYEYATVYRQFAAKEAMEKVGVAWHPGPMATLLPFALCIPLYIYRQEVVTYLDVPWVPVATFVIGLPIFVICTTAITVSVIAMLMIPARIVAATGNPVLVDMMTAANAPK